MNIHDLTVSQLKRAVSIKEKIEELGRELRSILGASGNPMPAQKRMSPAARRKIAAAQKARWAKLRRTETTTRPATPAAKASKKKMSPAARAKLSAKLKAYWAAKKKSRNR